jgi:flagellar hook-associated protein 3 FlgL
MIYDAGVSSIQKQTNALLQTQQQISTGRRILAPSDDPVAAARALEVTQAKELNAQYRLNQDSARSALGLAESQLASVGELLTVVRERAVQGANASLSATDRRFVAQELRARFDEMLGIANSTDGTGMYLFSGYQGASKPFAGSVEAAANGAIQYLGDDGQRLLQVSASRQLAVSDAGSEVFLRVRSGNGIFSATAAAANTGTGLIDAGSAVQVPLPDAAVYEIRFTSPTQYTVRNATAGADVSTGNAYSAGAAITIAGRALTVSGAPATGDVFTLAPSTSRDVFQTVGKLILALESQSGIQLANSVGEALTNLSQAQDNFLETRAAIGTRLNEVDSLSDVSEDVALQYETTLSRLQDLDYAAAISQLTREQSTLEAAQRSFARVSGLSLFDYL